MKELVTQTGFTLNPLKSGQLIEGRVVSVARNEVFVDLAAKSEGIISGHTSEEDLELAKNLQVGDKVLATVVQSENDQGYIVLSLKRAAPEMAWRRAQEALKSGEILEVKVVDFNRGGLVVEWETLRGFVPFSHLATEHQEFASLEKAGELLGKRLSVKAIELDRSLSRLVLSEKRAAVDEKKLKEFFQKIKDQPSVSGKVTAVFPFGVVVKLADGVEGLLHIGEMDWVRVEDPQEVFKLGDRVEATVLGFDEQEGKLRLSQKALKENPWQKITESYQVGDKVKGTVSKIVPYGAFLRLPEGIEGLIHVSETTGPLTEGEEVEAVIINLEPEKQKLGLSVKQLKTQISKRKTTT